MYFTEVPTSGAADNATPQASMYAYIVDRAVLPLFEVQATLLSVPELDTTIPPGGLWPPNTMPKTSGSEYSALPGGTAE